MKELIEKAKAYFMENMNVLIPLIGIAISFEGIMILGLFTILSFEWFMVIHLIVIFVGCCVAFLEAIGL